MLQSAAPHHVMWILCVCGEAVCGVCSRGGSNGVTDTCALDMGDHEAGQDPRTRASRRSQAVAAPSERVSDFADERGEVWICRGVTIWPRL